MDKKNARKKLPGFSYFIAFVIGASLAIILTQQILEYINIEIDYYLKVGIYCFSALFFGFVICLSTPSLIRWVYKIGNKFEHTLSGYTSREITSGTIGLILGLLIAFLLSDLISLIPVYPISMILTVLTYIVLSIVGIRLGMKYVSEIIIINNKKEENKIFSPGQNYKILDNSVIIDGRILELVRTGFLEGPFIISAFTLNQLKNVAENPDMLKRNRGRRGLDIINALQNEENIKVIMSDIDYPEISEIDTKILKLAQQFHAKVITNDYNLNKLANVMKVSVLNINELSNAIKPVALPGETMTVNIVKPGKEHGQGIGFLEDGTMIVVENGGDYVGKIMEATVTTSLQTNAGRMIFTRIMQNQNEDKQ